MTVAGVVGIAKFHYNIWGEAVNTASRMESPGLPDKTQTMGATYELLLDGVCLCPKGRVVDTRG